MPEPAENPAQSAEVPLTPLSAAQASAPSPNEVAAAAGLPVNTPPGEHDAYAALRIVPFRWYVAGNTLSLVGLQMQTMAVGWEIYELTGSTLSLAWVGLVQVVPVICLALVAGQVADRFNRRKVIAAAGVGIGLASFGLAVNSFYYHSVPAMYSLLFLTGIARAFQQPAKSSFMPTLVPRNVFSNAVTWSTSGFQLAAVTGPAAAGGVIAITGGAAAVYVFDAVAAALFVVLLAIMPATKSFRSSEPFTWSGFVAGIRFLRDNPIILSAITLDLFAVLLGGATALLPVYAKDVLAVGPAGLGWLEAAPAVGAMLMAMIIAHRPPIERAGKALILSVIGFGLATIVFGLSENFLLSLGMMFLIGALDNISVVIRHTLVQVLTPDQMRGRVSAVNGMFISMSNELGRFESGVVARMFDPVVAVVSGGVGTLFIVALAAIYWPELRGYGRLGSER